MTLVFHKIQSFLEIRANSSSSRMFYVVKHWYKASVAACVRYVLAKKDLDQVFRPSHSMEWSKSKTVPVHSIRLYGEQGVEIHLFLISAVKRDGIP
jgi:hypothetical protein